ncbi:MAG: hypothetical protein ARM1_0824 [Candidatus Micrarchaeota archaeon]|nr:MAG: hypothetical protein ARM1_0824 [Candidatus Micrarchaeota archaeon]
MIKLQSSMEYLITYGWAFLIIAVVLIALVLLGVFNTNAGDVCITSSQFICNGIAFTRHITTHYLYYFKVNTSNGELEILHLGQLTTNTWYNPIVFITTNQSLNGSNVNLYYTPSTFDPYYPYYTYMPDMVGGNIYSANLTIFGNLGLFQYNVSANDTYFPPQGTQFHGYLWIAYSLNATTSCAVPYYHPLYLITYGVVERNTLGGLAINSQIRNTSNPASLNKTDAVYYSGAVSNQVASKDVSFNPVVIERSPVTPVTIFNPSNIYYINSRCIVVEVGIINYKTH